MGKAYKEVTIENLNQGAIQELFEPEWKALLADIADGNKPAEASRTLTIKIAIKPDATRQSAKSRVGITLSLPAKKDHESVILLDGDGVGGVTAYTTNAEQLELDAAEQKKPEAAHA